MPSAPDSSGALYDELLVTLTQGGDRKAADLLARRWHPRLLRAARRYVGDTSLAEQLAQDCWLGIWRGLPRLRDPSRFAPWVFAILRRRGASALRDKNATSTRMSDDQLPEDGIAPQQEDSIAINQAFATLPPDQRLAAHLHFVEGLTLRVIAEIQGVPLGTAKTRLFHARRKLKAALLTSEEGDSS